MNSWRNWRTAAKYKNKRVDRGGQVFDSKREASDYDGLAMLERGGVIRDLKRQVTIPLIVNGVTITRYRADFTYIKVSTGKTVIHETKGFWTDLFRIKWKLLQAIHGDEFEYLIS